MRLKCTNPHARFSVRVPMEFLPHARLRSQPEYTRSSYHRVGHLQLNSYGHMLGAYHKESYRVLQSIHGVTLILNLPVYYFIRIVFTYLLIVYIFLGGNDERKMKIKSVCAVLYFLRMISFCIVHGVPYTFT